MSKWRPEVWETPDMQDCENVNDFLNGYEAGADAMLGALRKRGVPDYDPKMDYQIHNGKYNHEDNGVRVFIPDDSQPENTDDKIDHGAYVNIWYHPAAKVIEDGYFCEKCGDKVMTHYERHEVLIPRVHHRHKEDSGISY